MPDWITHIAVAYTVCVIFSFRWKQFDIQNTVIVMAGALIPDLFKVQLLLNYFHVYASELITPFHLPVGALVIAGIISLFFQNHKSAFLFLAFGVATHFLLDLLLINVGGGMQILYPFNWERFTLDIISPTDFNVTLVAVAVALAAYLISTRREKLKEIFGMKYFRE